MNSCVNLAEVNKPSAVYQLNWQTFVAAASYCYLIVQRAALAAVGACSVQLRLCLAL